MDGQAKQTHDYRFLAGLVMGSVVGAGLAMLLAPRAAAEIRARAADSAKNLGKVVSEGYRGASLRVTDAVDGLTRKGQKVRDGVCDTVVRGAQGVERGAQDIERGARDVQRFATDAKTDKVV